MATSAPTFACFHQKLHVRVVVVRACVTFEEGFGTSGTAVPLHILRFRGNIWPVRAT